MPSDHAVDRSVTRRRLRLAFFIVTGFLLVEFATALLAGSLTLLADAGHMLTDAAGLGMALGAMTVADRDTPARQRTYGRYRLEMLAAAANAVLLTGVAVYAIVEGLRRIGTPPAVDTGPVLVVASIGLAVNAVSWILLRSPTENLNLRGARLEVLADLLGSFAAVAAALLMRYAGWSAADAWFGLILGLFILPRAIRLGLAAGRVLMQHAPDRIDVAALSSALQRLDGVSDIHDLHVWTLTSGIDVATAHLTVSEGMDPQTALLRASSVLRDEFGIRHATIQIEPADHGACLETAW